MAIPESTATQLSPLLSFVAISQLNQADETLQQVVLQTIAFLPGQVFKEAEDVGSALKALFGLEIPLGRLGPAIDGLRRQAVLVRDEDDKLLVAGPMRAEIESRVEAARVLEEKVKVQWLAMCAQKFSGIDSQTAWRSLQVYFFKLFRRHGMQTVALLDSNLAKSGEHQKLLSANLNEVLTETCAAGNRTTTETAINEFVSTVGTDPERTAYVVQLADGAFNYFALSAPPEIAEHLKRNLEELTLFLDTNFLVGVFGLDTNPLVAVSRELMREVTEYKLPFKLRYHEATDTELRRTINAIASSIKSRHWSSELSRAAARSPFVSGIERHFHEENAKNTVDPDVFFKPYDHVDILLKERGVLIHRSYDGRIKQRADLTARYTEYLKERDREKAYEAVDHDMTVLDCVRQLRSKARSSLDARALLITCDATLNRFDWLEVRHGNDLPCTVLPNQFLQLLRPYIQVTPEFDKSFAETFAIPEFRAIAGGYHLAASRLLSLLATYKDLKEKTASSLLSNTLLLDHLRQTKTLEQARDLVESAVIATNAELIEDNVALQAELKDAREAQAALGNVEKRLCEMSDQNSQLEEKSESARKHNEELEEKLAATEAEKKARRLADENVTSTLEGLKKRLLAVEARASSSERGADRWRTATALLIAFAFIGLWEWSLHHYLVGQRILNHTNAYSIRSLVTIAVLLLALGMARPKLRGLLWLTIGVGVLIGLLTVLGGPH